jgi:hypothetical protein
MFAQSSLLLAPASGFVAFDGGGAVVADRPSVRSLVRVPATVERPAPPAADVVANEGMRQSATWQPAFAERTRRVEASLIVALCAYFALGLARLVGWI